MINIENFQTEKGIHLQTDFAKAVLANQEIPVQELLDVDQDSEKVLETIVKEFDSIGIKQTDIDSVASGRYTELSDASKKSVLDHLLSIAGMAKYTLDSIVASTSINQTDLFLADMVRSLYDQSRISVIGNTVLISVQDWKGYSLISTIFGSKHSGGFSMPLGLRETNSDIRPSDYVSVNLVNLHKDDRSRAMQDHDTDLHEKWHAFDRLRKRMIENAGETIDVAGILKQGELDIATRGLLVELPTEFVRHTLNVPEDPNDHRIKRTQDELLAVVQVELPAHIIGFLKLDNSKLTDDQVETVIDRVLGAYFLNGLIDVEGLRRDSKLEDGRMVIDENNIGYKIQDNLAIAVFGEKDRELEAKRQAYLHYYSKRNPAAFGGREFKEGKQEELKANIQTVLDFYFNDPNSPVVKLRGILVKALTAFAKLTEKRQDHVQALVELSHIPFHRWAAYVRKETGTA